MAGAKRKKPGKLEASLTKQVADALWLPEELTEEQAWERVKAALALLEGIGPEGEVEGMLAAQMVATHSGAMECLRRAMLTGQSFEGRDQNLRHANKLLSLYARQLEVFDKRRGRGQQKVTVEHVHVEAGGQAIVGNVQTDTGKRRSRARPEGIPHDPEMPYEAPAPAKARRRG